MDSTCKLSKLITDANEIMLFRYFVAIFVMFSGVMSPACAQDIYNPIRNELTIQSVEVSGITYTNVVITVGNVLSVIGGAPVGSTDSYNPTLNQLTIPSVQVGSASYTNVVITVGQVISIEGIEDEESAAAVLTTLTVIN